MEDDFKDSLRRNVGDDDKRDSHDEDEKRSPASVVPDAPDDAAHRERNGPDNDRFRTFTCKDPEPQQRQNRYQKRHCHTMDRTSERQNRPHVIHPFVTDVDLQVLHVFPFGPGPGVPRPDRSIGVR